MQFIRKLIKSSKGATAIEYGLIAALIAVAAIAAIQGRHQPQLHLHQRFFVDEISFTAKILRNGRRKRLPAALFVDAEN